MEDVDFALAGGRSEQNVQLLTRIWGGYLGEVIRRNVGGRWTDSRGASGYPGLQVGRQTIFPHDAVRWRLRGEMKTTIRTFYQQVRDLK